jgi:hypothetical protein
VRIADFAPPTRILALAALGGLAALHGCQEAPQPTEPALAVIAKRTLTITGKGTGNGVVTSSPAGINCTITAGVAAATGCVAQFDRGVNVTLTAVPESGHSFVGFLGLCGGSQACIVPMGINRKVPAQFLKGPFRVRIGGTAGGGNGVVQSQAGLVPAINCTITNGTPAQKNCGAQYPAYTSLTLTATPAPGHSFAGWGAPCSGTGTCEYTVIQGKTIPATFTSSLVRLTVAGSGNGTGGVKSQTGLTPAIDCSISAGLAGATGCTGDYPVSTVVTLTATPGPLSNFTGWSGACTGTGICQVTLAAAATVTAAFTAFAPALEATEGRWEPTFSTSPVIAVHLTLLPTGRVMFWGNAGEARQWVPTTGGLTDVTNPFELFCSGQTLLPDGRMLVAGGHISDGRGLASAAIFNPFTSSWTLTGSMAKGRWYPTLTVLPNGEVLVLGGTDANGANVVRPEVWNGSTWRALTGADRTLPYYPRMFVAPNGRVLLAGEEQATYYLDPGGTGGWSLIGNRVAGSRSYGSAVMYAPGKVLYVGGGDPPLRSAEVIDLNQPAPAWRAVTDQMAFARRQMNATLLADGKVLVTHGTSGAGFNNEAAGVRDAELWDPATEEWTTMADEAVVRVYHSTALLLPDARVLSIGSGDGGGTAQRYSGQVFTPPYLFAPDGSLAPRPTITAAPATLSYGQQFTVQSPEAANVTRGNLIRLSSATHAMNESQLIYPLTFSSAGANSLSATAPANANLATPGPYMLFLLNTNGVPSLAKMVLIGP